MEEREPETRPRLALLPHGPGTAPRPHHGPGTAPALPHGPGAAPRPRRRPEPSLGRQSGGKPIGFGETTGTPWPCAPGGAAGRCCPVCTATGSGTKPARPCTPRRPTRPSSPSTAQFGAGRGRRCQQQRAHPRPLGPAGRAAAAHGRSAARLGVRGPLAAVTHFLPTAKGLRNPENEPKRTKEQRAGSLQQSKSKAFFIHKLPQPQ